MVGVYVEVMGVRWGWVGKMGWGFVGVGGGGGWYVGGGGVLVRWGGGGGGFVVRNWSKLLLENYYILAAPG